MSQKTASIFEKGFINVTRASPSLVILILSTNDIIPIDNDDDDNDDNDDNDDDDDDGNDNDDDDDNDDRLNVAQHP